MLNTILTLLVNNIQLLANILLVTAVVGVLIWAFKKPRAPAQPQPAPPQGSQINPFVVAISVILITGIYGLLFFYSLQFLKNPEVEVVAFGGLYIFIALFIFLFLLAFFPGLVKSLTNEPNANKPFGTTEFTDEPGIGYTPSTFGFFTVLQQGQAKWIERLGRPIRAIMSHSGYMWLGDRIENNLRSTHRAYWEVVPAEWRNAEGQARSGFSHPIPFPVKEVTFLWVLYSPLSILWWAWKRWMYKIVGVVFTGIYPWQTVRVYPFEDFRTIADTKGKTYLKKRRTYSDYYRVAQFQFTALVGAANTQDKVELRILLNMVLRVFNLYLVAYSSNDAWQSRLLASLTNAVGLFTRSREVDRVLTVRLLSEYNPANPPSQEEIRKVAQEMQNELKRIGTRSATLTPEQIIARGNVDFFHPNEEGEVLDIGIEVVRIHVMDITPTNTEVQRQLSQLAITEVQARSIERLAKANAAQIREQGEALKEYPEAAEVVRVEGMVRAVDAAKGGAQIFFGTSAITPGEAAIVSAIRNTSNRAQDKD